ncbi:hypothetical protein AAFF_G00203490 [Aldrovandia affinis]|uniref:Calponin-homology (CH) domain-containing protein n=1 Tax=Aldrovandia affinis TaxID=143900 RepID=A0AAD7WVB9_9TELE|nr:hypothetical protein AAFF_G00203490 [Aldrovandia affinis]
MDPSEEEGAIPLDIDNIQMLLQVEQEQIQKRTFTNWINAQLSKRTPPAVVSDLFTDLQDGVRLLDLLEVLSGQRMKREKGRGVFQGRSHIETALNFLKKKSIKLVNINVPDIIDGRPSIILGLIWSIILHCHIEELASSLSFGSCQSSLESLSSMDSADSSPVQRGASPLHPHFRLSAKKALLLWVREQCNRASCSLDIKDFKSSWRSGVAFLAILRSLRPDLVDLSQASARTNQQNLEEAFRVAERELRIPRLLEPQDIDVQDPDEKSIMTYVAQFLQYSKDLPVSRDTAQIHHLALPIRLSPVHLPTHFTPAVAASPVHQALPNQKVLEVTCWLQKAHQELLESWASAAGGSYVERYQAFQMSAAPLDEQRRYVKSMLSAARGSAHLSEEQRALGQAWDVLAEMVQQCERALDVGLPAPLDGVGRWLLQVESALTEQDGDTQGHAQAAKDAREKRELLKNSLKELDLHVQTLHNFPNVDQYGSTLVPADKLDQLNQRFMSARVSAKYHGLKLEYQEWRHTMLELLAQTDGKLCSWRTAYNSQDAVRARLQDWHLTVDNQGLISHLEDSLCKMKLIASNYTSKAALAEDSQRVSQQVREAEADSVSRMEAVTGARSAMERALSAWDTYNQGLSSLQAWLGQEASWTPSHGTVVTAESLAEWGSHHAHLNEAANYLTEVTEAGTSHALAAQLQGLNRQWADYINRNKSVTAPPPGGVPQQGPPAVQSLIWEAALLMSEPVEVSSGTLRTYRKRLQLMVNKVKEVDLGALAASPDWSAESQQMLTQAVHEVIQELHRAEQVSDLLQRNASALEGRLVELEHWETEAREIYQLLKEGEKQGQQGHDPRAKVLISRGLQLEGQMVAEEQDFGVGVEAVRDRGLLLCLSTCKMQDRISHTLVQAQEAVGMLSSLGARRPQDPAEFQPPPKVLRLSHTEEVPLSQAQTDPQLQVQGYTYAQAVTQPRSKDRIRPLTFTRSQAHVQAQTHSKDLGNVPAQTQPFIQPSTFTQYDDQHPHTPPKAQPQPQTWLHEQSQTEVQLQDHIQGAIAAFSDKRISEEQTARKEASLQLLDSEVLEGFLRSLENLRGFCSMAQLRDMEVLSRSLRVQWEACMGAEASQQLGALGGLGDMLSPDVTHHLARAQLRESERRLKTVQRTPGDSYQGEHSPDPLCHSDTSEGQLRPTFAQAIVRTDNVEVKQTAELTVIKTTSPEEESVTLEELERYQASSSSFRAQLDRNQQCLLYEFPSDTATPSTLRTHLHQLQVLKEETEALWFEFELQYSQCSHSSQCSQLEGVEWSLEEGRNELLQQWRAQQISIQRRVKSLCTAVRVICPVDDQVTCISERLDRLFEKPKDISGFTLTDASSLQQDIKDLEERIQQEMDQLSGLDHEDSPELSQLDLEARLAVGHMALGCRRALGQFRQRVWKGGTAIQALDRFLSSLRGVERDISGVQAPLPEQVARAGWDGRARLASVRQSVRAAGDEASRLDQVLETGRLSLSRDGGPVSCQDLVLVLARRLEEADTHFARHLQEGAQPDASPLAERRRAMMGALREVQGSVESQGLKEPSLPALQHRMRSLADMEGRLAAHRIELQSLWEETAQIPPDSSGGDPIEDLEALWEEAHRTVTERQERCRTLTELLKRYQGCRSNMCATLQRAEQTVSEQASYMGKDNLQRLIAKVHGIKEDLAGLAGGVDEIWGVCRQLHSQLREFPDCSDAPFESEAHDLVDRWLDVTEKAESHMDSLQVGMALWMKLLELGGEVERWTGDKLAVLTEGRPFHSKQEVQALQDEIRNQEERIKHFHKRSTEIQELLQSKEPPLDLQVMETQLRKRMEYVKELFSKSSDVFRSVAVARGHVGQRMVECQSDLRDNQSSLSVLNTSQTQPPLPQIQVPPAGEAMDSMVVKARVSSCEMEEGFPVQRGAPAMIPDKPQHDRGLKSGDVRAKARKAVVDKEAATGRKQAEGTETAAPHGEPRHSDTRQEGAAVTGKAGAESLCVTLGGTDRKMAEEPTEAVKAGLIQIQRGTEALSTDSRDAETMETGARHFEEQPWESTETQKRVVSVALDSGSSGHHPAPPTDTESRKTELQRAIPDHGHVERPEKAISVALDVDLPTDTKHRENPHQEEAAPLHAEAAVTDKPDHDVRDAEVLHVDPHRTVALDTGKHDTKTNTQRISGRVCEKKVVSIVLDTDLYRTDTQYRELLPHETESLSADPPLTEKQSQQVKTVPSDSSGAGLRESSDSCQARLRETGETKHVGPGPWEHAEPAHAESALRKTPQAKTETERIEVELQGTVETLQPQKKLTLILDSDTLHVQSPGTRGTAHTDILRILSSGQAHFPAIVDTTDTLHTWAQTGQHADLRVSAPVVPGDSGGRPEMLSSAGTREQRLDLQSSEAGKLWEELGETPRMGLTWPHPEQGQQAQPGQNWPSQTLGTRVTEPDEKKSSAHLESVISAQVERAKARLYQLQAELPGCSEEMASLVELQIMLGKMKWYQDQLENESHALAALGIQVSRLLSDPVHQGQATPITPQELQAMQDRYRNLREKCMLGQRSVRSELQERERAQEEIQAVKVRLVALTTRLPGPGYHSSTRALQEVRKELDSQSTVLQGIMGGLRRKYSEKQALVPVEVQGPLQEVAQSLKDLQAKVEERVEKSSPLHRLSCKVVEVMEGLRSVLDLLQLKSPSVPEAQITQKRVWDTLDRWHSRIAVLEGEVQDVWEEQPEQAQLLMDRLMEPLQLYQHVAKQAEQRTAFLSKVPTLMQEYEEMIKSSSRWLREAQSWLDRPITYTTARCLSSHAQGLQAVLDDSEQMRRGLQGFGLTLQELSAMCNIGALEERLVQADRRVVSVQQSIVGPLSRLQYAASEVEAIEGEVKLMEKNVTKIRTILSSIDTASISPEEHLRNRQVILDNIQSMKRTIDEIQKCRSGLDLPAGGERDPATIGQPTAQSQISSSAPQWAPLALSLQGGWEEPPSSEEEEDEEDDRGGSTSSSETLTGSIPEDPDEMLTDEGYAGTRVTSGSGVKPGTRVTPGSGVKPGTRVRTLELLGESRLARQGKDTQLEWLQETVSVPQQTVSIRQETVSVLQETPILLTHTFTQHSAAPSKMILGAQPGLLSIQTVSLDTQRPAQDTGTALPTTALKPVQSVEHPLGAGLTCSTSVIQPSSESELIQQSCCLQQWRELGADLSEQRELWHTPSLVTAVEHVRLSPESQTHTGSRTEPVGGAATQKEYALLHTQLGAQLKTLEELGRGGPLKVAAQLQVETEGLLTQHVPSSQPEEDGETQAVGDSSGRSVQEERRGSTDLPQGFEKHLQGLSSLLELGGEHLACSQRQLHSRDHLQTLLSRHKKYFWTLAARTAALGHLWRRVPEEAQGRVEGARMELEQGVGVMLQRAVEEGAQLQRTLETWTQWDESNKQLEELLQDVEARLLIRGKPEETKGQLTDYQQVKGLLEEGGARLHRALDLGRALQAGGQCGGVGVALQGLEARWLAAQRRAEQWKLRAQELGDLRSRFRQDSATMGENLSILRTQLGQLLELSKEAEAISSLHVSVSHSGAQLLQLKDEDVSGLRAQLEQLEQRWAGTRAAQQDVQQRLHKLLMEKLSLEEVMEELNLWMGKVESRLTEDELRVHQASSTASLGPLLQHCKEYKVEMALHQLSLDFVSQAVVQTSGLEDIQEKRYERTSLAERLGALHLRWLTLQGALASQAHRVERLQQICADRESRLLALCRWVSGRRGRMEELQRPSSLSQAQRAVKECEDMELKLKLRSVELQELQDSCRSGEGGGEQEAASDCAFIVQTDSVRQDLTALSQQISTVRPALLWVVGQWEQLEGALGEAVLRTVRTSHALELTRTPQLSLHALQSHIQRLQLLQEEARRNEEAWEALRRSCSSLGARSALRPPSSYHIGWRRREHGGRR